MDEMNILELTLAQKRFITEKIRGKRFITEKIGEKNNAYEQELG